MWHALRAELAYFRPWLLGGLGIALTVIVILSGVMWFLDDEEGPPMFVVMIFPALAGMVVSFIAQSYRVEERRARLLLAGPLTPRQLGWVTALLPICFVGLSTLAAPVLIGVGALIAGKFEPAAWSSVGGFTVQFLAYAQLGPLAQESSAARRQQRSAAAVAGWLVFAAAILVLALSQAFLHSVTAHLGQATTVVTAMVVAAELYRGRSDYTR